VDTSLQLLWLAIKEHECWAMRRSCLVCKENYWAVLQRGCPLCIPLSMKESSCSPQLTSIWCCEWGNSRFFFAWSWLTAWKLTNLSAPLTNALPESNQSLGFTDETSQTPPFLLLLSWIWEVPGAQEWRWSTVECPRRMVNVTLALLGQKLSNCILGIQECLTEHHGNCRERGPWKPSTSASLCHLQLE
jgi:hypothetical protein